MSQPDNRWVVEVFKQHPALLVSALYVIASVIGMFYAWAFLREFGINVFNYAQITDFLIASLKEPATWLLVAFAVALVMIDNVASRRFHKRNQRRWMRWYGSPRYRFLNNFVAIAIVLMFIMIYAGHQALRIERGAGKVVDVRIADGSNAQSFVLLGTTGQFIFLLNREENRVLIHPFENVESISFQAD